jgi:hypothetical protein
MAFLNPFTVRPRNFLVILLITGLFSGCAAFGAQQFCQTGRVQIRCPDRTENVQVMYVDSHQIYDKEAVRFQFPDGGWVVYLAEDAGPEVLKWELNQIALGTIWDKI